MSGKAWVTLATNDTYSLGALVLAHSLKNVNTSHSLVAIITPGVTPIMRSKLQSVFDEIREVDVLDSKDETNLRLLARPELGITFTKLHCWRLTHYEKCVFLDADTLVLQNCDELFDREELSAAPDVGWPDCFNSGVFVFKPSEDTYNKLINFAISHGSFDGGDQGLLNLFFNDWSFGDIRKHLPFIYNLCSAAVYSYLPAFKWFGKDTKIIHFISGSAKPWLQNFNSETRTVRAPVDSPHLQAFLQLWWDIFCNDVHPVLSTEMTERRVNIWYNSAPISSSSSNPSTYQPYIPEHEIEEHFVFSDPWEDYDQYVNNTPMQFYYSHSDNHSVISLDSNPAHNNSISYEPDSIVYFQQPVSFDGKTHFDNLVKPHSHSHSHIGDIDDGSGRDIQNCNITVQNTNNVTNKNNPSPFFSNSAPSHNQSNISTAAVVMPIFDKSFNNAKCVSNNRCAAQNMQNPLQLKTIQNNNQTVTLSCPSPVPTLSYETNKTFPLSPCPASTNIISEEFIGINRWNDTSVISDTPEETKQGGLACAFAEIKLGEPLSSEQAAIEDHLRRQSWEQGNIDYLGKDSFDNIWDKIQKTLSSTDVKEVKEEEEGQKDEGICITASFSQTESLPKQQSLVVPLDESSIAVPVPKDPESKGVVPSTDSSPKQGSEDSQLIGSSPTTPINIEPLVEEKCISELSRSPAVSLPSVEVKPLQSSVDTSPPIKSPTVSSDTPLLETPKDISPPSVVPAPVPSPVIAPSDKVSPAPLALSSPPPVEAIKGPTYIPSLTEPKDSLLPTVVPPVSSPAEPESISSNIISPILEASKNASPPVVADPESVTAEPLQSPDISAIPSCPLSSSEATISPPQSPAATKDVPPSSLISSAAPASVNQPDSPTVTGPTPPLSPTDQSKQLQPPTGSASPEAIDSPSCSQSKKKEQPKTASQVPKLEAESSKGKGKQGGKKK